MKLIFCACLFVALASPSLGQTFATVVPKTPCGIAAQACYTQNKALIDRKFKDYDFSAGCQVVRTAVNCAKKVNEKGDCTGAFDVEVTNVINTIINEQGGVCDENGSVTPCGTGVLPCVKNMSSIAQLFKERDLSVCPVVLQFETCAEGILNDNICTGKLNGMLARLDRVFMEDALEEGCQGPCGKKVGGCLANMAEIVASLTTNTMEKFCKSLDTAIECIKQLPQTDECKGESQGSNLLDSALRSQQTAMSDFCSADGKVTPCAAGVAKCAADLLQVKASDSVSKKCSVTADYLECMANIPCVNGLKPLVSQMTKQLTTDEIQLHCPTMGSCVDRMGVCQDKAKIFQGNQATEKSAYCTALKESVACFDVVRKDIMCETAVGSATLFEKLTRETYSSKCGAGLVQMSFLLLLVAVAASVQRYL